jgi:glycosyltransferase involved in cell wall biosynthesis
VSGGRSGVVLAIADLGSGGAQQVLSQLANRWAAEGRRVGVITLAGPEDDFFKLSERVTRIVVGGIGDAANPLDALRRNLQRIAALRAALKRFNGSAAVGFIGPMNVLLLLAARGLGYRVVVCERNDPARQSFGRAWDLLRRWLYRFADTVTANSRGALEAMRRYVSAEKLVFLPNPVRRAANVGVSGNREPVFLNVGRLHRQKGQDLAIAAFARVAEELPDWRLVIIGDGGARAELERAIAAAGLRGRVELTGRIDDPFDWYRRAAVFVFPSRYEGQPNALVEAMSGGLPVIASDDVSAHRDLVTSGIEGLLVPGEDVQALADAMRALAEAPARRSAMGEAAARKVEPYALDNVVAAWNAVIWRTP